jgi:iron complex transport system ATP-binding protein
VSARLHVDGVSVALGGRVVVHDVSLTAEPGQVVGVVGPNGSGKSTLLRAILGILAPVSGTVRVDGADVTRTRPRARARTLAAVLQDAPGEVDLSVEEVVLMGRACHKRPFQPDDADDRRIVAEALAAVGTGELARRPFARLSGGERQRVLIARAIAQQPRLLVMDEPTNHLDLRHQFAALALPRRLGTTAVLALHDLNLAAHYCDTVHVLHQGRQWGAGPPERVLRPDTLAAVYGVTATVTPHPATGRPHIAYDPSADPDPALTPGQPWTSTSTDTRATSPGSRDSARRTARFTGST